jgi:UDP-N-acetylmuramyl pentapeptide synthase
MPLALDLAHTLLRELAALRHEGKQMKYLRPDAKSQVTIEYSDRHQPKRIDSIVISTQHDEFDTDEKMQTRIAALAPASRRGEVIRQPNGVTLVDDSYNSSPAALMQSLAALKATTATRRAAVLGEMLELGDHAIALHEECGRAAADAALDWLVTVGGAPAGAMASAAIDAGRPAPAVAHVATADEASTAASARVQPGDVVLIKGSRGIGVARVVAHLKAEAA